jgi:predicted transcriptional regulator
MMATILEMAADIVAAHASTTNMTKEELVSELNDIYNALNRLEKGEVLTEPAEEESGPAVSRKKAFGRDKIYCMICGKGMKTLARHLKTSHDMTASEYRKQFDIPRSQSLAAKSYSEKRRQMAIDRGLGEKLAKARAARGKGKKKS